MLAWLGVERCLQDRDRVGGVTRGEVQLGCAAVGRESIRLVFHVRGFVQQDVRQLALGLKLLVELP